MFDVPGIPYSGSFVNGAISGSSGLGILYIGAPYGMPQTVVASSTLGVTVNVIYRQVGVPPDYTPLITYGYSRYVSDGYVRRMVNSFSGLTWLKNETVGVLTDGGIHPDVVVNSAGVATLSYPAAKVQLGYRYNSDGKILRVDAGSADGTSIGKTRRITRAAFLLHACGDFSFGPNFARLLPCEFTNGYQTAGQATPLFSGIHRDGVEAEYDYDNALCFRQNTGLPGVVQSLTLVLDEFDV